MRSLQITFTGHHLTHFGGLVLLQRFCQRLHLRRQLRHVVAESPRRTAYPPVDLLLALLFAIMADLRRINKTEILQYNGVWQTLLGLRQFPNQSTLRRFLKRLTPTQIRRLVAVHDHLRARLFGYPRPRTSVTFDLDSVVVVLYGTPQGARVGYNPKKPGRRSYHPLLGFEAHLQEFWHGTLRPGDAATSTGTVPFLRHCLAKTPATIARRRVRVRADAGFFRQRIVEFLDETGCGYAIVAKLHPPLKARARECRFRPLAHGWAAGEFRYRPLSWHQPHRFIVVRRPIPLDPVEARQLTLFTDRGYAYHVLVTNLPLQPWRIWRFYAKRATVEKNIRELLYDYPLGKIPTEAWVANVAFFHLLLLAYNLVHWFKRLCLLREYLFATLETVRTDFLVLPAKLTKQGSRNILTLPQDYHYRAEFQRALRRIARLPAL